MNRQERRRLGVKKKDPMISIKQSDIDRNIMIDDIDRQREYGMDMDKDEWMKLLGRLRAERERRFKNGNYR